MELKTKSVDCKLCKKHCLLPVNGGLLTPLNAELNPICYLLALLGAHHFLHISRIRVSYDNTKNCINLNPSSK
jgi:hypothetical protein